MDFGLSEDQLLLEETVRRFLAEQVPIERVRELREKDCPNDRAIWSALAELGVTGILVPEAQGGSGLALLDAALVVAGAGPCGDAHALPRLGGHGADRARARSADARAEAWLAGIATGELVFGVAVTELFSVREGAGVRARGGHAARQGDDGDRRLRGRSAPGGGRRRHARRGRARRRRASRPRASRPSTPRAARPSCVLDGVTPEAVFEGAGARDRAHARRRSHRAGRRRRSAPASR